MKKISSFFVLAFLAFGTLAIFWAGYDLGTTSYKFWVNGVQKEAKVISLDHVSGSTKGGNTYYYNLEIQGRNIISGFPYKLSEDSTYSVLTLENNEKVILGREGDNLFEIYSAQIGSKIMVFLTIAMFIFMPYGSYKMYSTLLPKRDNLWRDEY